MKTLTRVLLVMFVAFALWYFWSARQEQTTAPTSPTPTISDEATLSETDKVKYDELVEQITKFEEALYSRYPNDTSETFKDRIAPFASKEYLSWKSFDLDSGADLATLASLKNGDRLVAKIAKIELGEPDGPDVFYPVVDVYVNRYDSSGEIVSKSDDDPFQSYTMWKYTSDGWKVYPNP